MKGAKIKEVWMIRDKKNLKRNIKRRNKNKKTKGRKRMWVFDSRIAIDLIEYRRTPMTSVVGSSTNLKICCQN